MDLQTKWHPYQNGASIGALGSEEGVIVQDDEHVVGARITLERRNGESAQFAITCGLYGWFFQARYCTSEEEGRRDVEQMKLGLDQIIELLPNGTTDTEEAEPC